MLIKWANKKIQQRRPFQGGLLIKMHSRLTKYYNINGTDHLNVTFASYRTTKQAWLKLLQLPDPECRMNEYASVMELLLSFLLPHCWLSYLFLYVLFCSRGTASILDMSEMHSPARECPLPFGWAMLVPRAVFPGPCTGTQSRPNWPDD